MNSKVQELAKILEMTASLKGLASCLNPACNLLLEWSSEMEKLGKIHKRRFNLRSHLAHYLASIGMDDAANR